MLGRGPIGIVGALRWELSPLERALKIRRIEKEKDVVLVTGAYEEHEVVLTIGGIGQKRASHAAQILLDRCQPRVLISAGFGGALDVELQPGDLVFGERLLWGMGNGEWGIVKPVIRIPKSEFHSTPSLVIQAEETAKKLRLPFWRGTLLSLDMMLTESYEKRAAASSLALAVEMEGASVAQAAVRAGLPFLAIRSISDALDQDLGLNFNELLDGGGHFSGTRIFLALLAHPSALSPVWRLKRTAHEARHSLANFLLRLLSQPDLSASP